MACILFINDCAEFRQAMEYCLPKLGYNVLTAANEREARSVVAERAVDLILLDADVTSRSGLTLCETLGGDAKFARIPRVILAALNTAEFSARAKEAGAARVVPMPFEWDALLEVIAQLLPSR